MAPKAKKQRTPARRRAGGSGLTPAQLAGNERIPLPGGKWYMVCFEEDGTPITDPERCGIWEVGEDGRDVMWVGQAELADTLGVTPRWVQKLEERGLPARGFRGSCEYPIPHALIWYLYYTIHRAKGEKVNQLPMRQVWAEHARDQAAELAEIEYRMATDPKYRAEMEAAYREDWGEEWPSA